MAKENNNKSFVLRIDAATMEALEGWAADEFRSINGQLQWIIADALRRSGRPEKAPSRRTGVRRFDGLPSAMPLLQNPRFRPGAIIPTIFNRYAN